MIFLLATLYVIPLVRATTEVHVAVFTYNNLGGSSTSLGSLVNVRPAFEIAVEDLNREYNGTIKATIDFLIEDGERRCPNYGDNAERMIAEWYYRRRKDNAIAVLSAGGMNGRLLGNAGAQHCKLFDITEYVSLRVPATLQLYNKTKTPFTAVLEYLQIQLHRCLFMNITTPKRTY